VLAELGILEPSELPDLLASPEASPGERRSSGRDSGARGVGKSTTLYATLAE
jgi:hypothetical protein